MQPTYIFPEIDKLQNIFWRLNIACEIQVKSLPLVTSSGNYIIGNFYYTGGNYRKEPYFLATIVSDCTQESFLQNVSQKFSGYDLSVTSIHNPQNNFQLKIPRFQTPSQLKMILDIRGTE